MNALQEKYGDRVQFLLVYVREAHPCDGWSVEGWSDLEDAADDKARASNAAHCRKELGFRFPIALDSMDDATAIRWSGWPERLFVISTHQVRDLGTLMDPIVILHQGRVLLNSTVAELGTQLHMTQQSSPPPPDAPGLLFSEPAVGGFWSVWRGGGEGPLDLEVLFNAVVARPELAQSWVAGGGVA